MDRATERGFSYGNPEWGKLDSRMHAPIGKWVLAVAV
jgi:hypothetical protein